MKKNQIMNASFEIANIWQGVVFCFPKNKKKSLNGLISFQHIFLISVSVPLSEKLTLILEKTRFFELLDLNFPEFTMK